MSLIPRTMPLSSQMLPIHNPGHPESYVCSPSLGVDIAPLDCQIAVSLNWPKGNTPEHYYFREPAASNANRLPLHHHYGSCTVSIESAGPPLSEYLQPSSGSLGRANYFSISPDKLRGAAGYIIQKCAQESGGIGGYVTLYFAAAEKWLESLADSTNELRHSSNGTAGRPNDGSFLTLSITNPDGFAINPGNTDPSIAARLALHVANLSTQTPAADSPGRKAYFAELAEELRLKTERMTRGRSDGEMWWHDLDDDDSDMHYDPGSDDGSGSGGGGSYSMGDDSDGGDGAESTGSSPGKKKGGGASSSSSSGDDNNNSNNKKNNEAAEENSEPQEGDMVYTCDPALGSPTATDCEKLSWSGLRPPSATETLTPGQPKIYTQGTCALGISSTVATTITWAHLLAAFETLNTLCVQNPLRGVRGGRAFWGKQGNGVGGGWMLGGKRKRMERRDAVGGVSGAEALPEGVNVTVWRHDGGGEGDKGSARCEWGKAFGGKDVNGC